MPQLTEQQDKILHKLVRTDMPLRVVALEACVSKSAAFNFRRACATVDAMPDWMPEQIRRLFLMNMPTVQIAARLLLPVSSIRSLRRLDRFRGVARVRCGECGSLLPTPMSNKSKVTNRRAKIRGHISRDNIHAMGDVIVDLISLSDLQLIANPLFHHLSQRAEKVYEKIHGRKKDTIRPGEGHRHDEHESQMD